MSAFCKIAFPKYFTRVSFSPFLIFARRPGLAGRGAVAGLAGGDDGGGAGAQDPHAVGPGVSAVVAHQRPPAGEGLKICAI